MSDWVCTRLESLVWGQIYYDILAAEARKAAVGGRGDVSESFPAVRVRDDFTKLSGYQRSLWMTTQDRFEWSKNHLLYNQKVGF